MSLISSIPPWVPLDKRWRNALPHNETRPFTELEAAFSLSLDHDGRRQVTLRGLAKLWRWSTGKVSRFLARNGVEIDNFGGTVMHTPAGQWRDTGETAKLIDSRWLSEEAKQKRDAGGTVARHRRDVLKNLNKKPNPLIKDSTFAVPDWIDENAWSAFLEVRKQKKVPNTTSALSLIIKEIEKLKIEGHSPVAVLNQSVMRGWAGVFEISERGTKSVKPRPKPSCGLDTGTQQFLATTGR